MKNKYYDFIQDVKVLINGSPEYIETLGDAVSGNVSPEDSKRVIDTLNRALTLISHDNRAQAIAFAAVLLTGNFTKEGQFLMPATRDVISNIQATKRICRKGFRFTAKTFYVI